MWYRGIYICALIIMYGKACCETNDVLLQGPLYMWQTTISTIDSGANMLDLRSEALAQSKPVTFCSFLVCVMVNTTKSGVCEGIGATGN